MYNSINLNRVSRTLVLLPFLTLAMQGWAQNTFTIKSGFFNNYVPFVKIKQPIGDSLKLQYDFAVNNNNVLSGTRLLTFNKSTLKPFDTTLMAQPIQPSGSKEGFKIYENKNGKPQLYLSRYQKANGNSLGLEFYSINNSYQRGNLLFSKSIPNRSYVGSVMRDNKIYLITDNRGIVTSNPSPVFPSNPDTVFLNILNASTGSNIHSDFYTINDSSRAVIRNITYMIDGIQFHPKHDSLLILPSSMFVNEHVALININNTQQTREFLLPHGLFYFRNGLAGNGTRVFKAYKDHFVFSGHSSTLKFFPDPSFLAPYSFTRSWNNDSLELKIFDNMQKDMRSFAYNENPYSDDKYLVGSAPFDRTPFFANEVREVVIYRWNQWGQDSIVLFGEQNHVAFDVAADKNGDLYVCGTFNDFPNSDSNFVFLTKIPQYAIGLIDEGKIEPRFRVYPNPTAQHLHLSTEPEKLRHARYRVVNEAGATQLQGSLSPTEATIDVSSLSSGTYLLFIEYKEGSTSNALFLKE